VVVVVVVVVLVVFAFSGSGCPPVTDTAALDPSII
jgi:hypothetical protein